MIITILVGNKKTNIISLFVLFIIFMLLKFSYIFTFLNKYEYENIMIYSDTPLQTHGKILEKSLSLIKKSSFYNKDMEFTILVSDTFFKYKLFNPLGMKSFAKYYPVVSCIYINKTDSNGVTYRETDKRTRNLYEVIAHEATHHMLFKSVDLLTYFRLPKWIHEGYADFIAQSSTLSNEEIIGVRKSDPNSMSLRYFDFKVRVTREIKKHGTIIKLIRNQFHQNTRF